MASPQPIKLSQPVSLLRSAAVVASGQAVGYAVALAAAPILSRLYSPRDFGLLAIFVTLMSVLGTIATFRYDYAIPLPKDERSAASLSKLAKWIVALVTACLAIVAALFGGAIDRALFHAQDARFSLLLAAAVAAFAGCEIHSAHLVRAGRYADLSRLRLYYAVTCVATQLIVPILWVTGPLGLLIGQIAGYVVASFVVGRIGRRDQPLRPRVDLRELRRVAVEYRLYPLVDIWSSLAKVLAVNCQALLIAWAYSPAAAGCLALAQRLLSAPISMLSFSISRVYYSEAAALARDDPAALHQLFVGTLKRLALLATPPLAVVCVLAPWTFAIIFGAEWHTAGVYCSLLCPLILLRVLSFVLGPTLDVIHRQGLRLVRELTCLALIAGGVVAARWFGWTELGAVAASSALGCVGYSLSVVLTWRALLAHHANYCAAERPQLSAEAA